MTFHLKSRAPSNALKQQERCYPSSPFIFSLKSGSGEWRGSPKSNLPCQHLPPHLFPFFSTPIPPTHSDTPGRRILSPHLPCAGRSRHPHLSPHSSYFSSPLSVSSRHEGGRASRKSLRIIRSLIPFLSPARRQNMPLLCSPAGLKSQIQIQSFPCPWSIITPRVRKHPLRQ